MSDRTDLSVGQPKYVAILLLLDTTLLQYLGGYYDRILLIHQAVVLLAVLVCTLSYGFMHRESAVCMLFTQGTLGEELNLSH